MLCHDPYFYDTNLISLDLSSNYEDLKLYLGTAPTPFLISKRFDGTPGSTVSVGVMNGAGIIIKGGYIKAGDTLTINTDPNYRNVTINRNGKTFDAFTGIAGGTLVQFLSATQDHVYINGGATINSSPGFHIEFNRRYLGL